jgi:hypothetical protein
MHGLRRRIDAIDDTDLSFAFLFRWYGTAG